MENNIENFDPSLVYFGERGQDFKKMIRSILSLGMSDEYIPYLTTPVSLNMEYIHQTFLKKELI